MGQGKDPGHEHAGRWGRGPAAGPDGLLVLRRPEYPCQRVRAASAHATFSSAHAQPLGRQHPKATADVVPSVPGWSIATHLPVAAHHPLSAQLPTGTYLPNRAHHPVRSTVPQCLRPCRCPPACCPHLPYGRPPFPLPLPRALPSCPFSPPGLLPDTTCLRYPSSSSRPPGGRPCPHYPSSLARCPPARWLPGAATTRGAWGCTRPSLISMVK